jgi:hypothetical protein
MNESYITIVKLNAIKAIGGSSRNKTLAVTLNKEMISLGYVMSEELFKIVSTMSKTNLTKFRSGMITALSKITGSDVTYMPMYAGFPEEVIEADLIDLYINAIYHYWTLGEWTPPKDPTIKRQHRHMFDRQTLIKIDVASDEQVTNIFYKIVSSKDSISEQDKEILRFFLKMDIEIRPETITFRENAAVVAGELLIAGQDVSPALIKKPNDVLRIASYLSKGDITLSENTKFLSFKRSIRKKLVDLLEPCVSDVEDMSRNRERWVRLFHNLHIGEYFKTHKNIANFVPMFRTNSLPQTIGSTIEVAIENKDWVRATAFLQEKPGDMIRRFDKIARGNPEIAVSGLKNAAKKVPTRLLASMYGYLKSRNSGDRRMIMPKGNSSAPLLLPDRESLNPAVVSVAESIVNDELFSRFKTRGQLGKVWIDPNLFECPLPTQMRSASTGKFSAARGTKFSLDKDQNTIRLFIYWIGMDIDLSATFHNDDFAMIEQVSWTNLKTGKCYHSGDIVHATHGAAEFIDVDIDWALEAGYRYIAMSVRVFNGPSFVEHEKCYAGWMMRKKPNSSEIFDPATIVQKVDLMQKSRVMVPAMFDLKERKVIWTDLSGDPHSFTQARSLRSRAANMVENDRGTMENSIKYAATMSNRRMTIGELVKLHAEARGSLVVDRDSADVKFDMSLAFDTDTINSELIA